MEGDYIDIKTNTFKVQIVSDIHLELRNSIPVITPEADILLLCGDIGTPKTPLYKEFLSQASSNFLHVFVITGNHEYYGNHDTMEEIDEKIREIVSSFNNITLLHNSAVTIRYADSKYIRIFGSTLWSDVSENWNKVLLFMNDYRKIRKKVNNKKGGYMRRPVRTNDTLALHWQAVHQLEQEIQNSKDKNLNLVVMTHHLPSFSCVHDDFKSGPYADLNCAYASDLDKLVAAPVVLWVHGHSHRCSDVKINNIRIVSNPFGYPGETTGRKKENLVVDIDNEISIINL